VIDAGQDLLTTLRVERRALSSYRGSFGRTPRFQAYVAPRDRHAPCSNVCSEAFMRVRAGSDRGFSLIEMMTVLAITSVISGMVIGAFSLYSQTVQGDADMRVVEWQLKLARETAINQRRAIQIQFTNPNLITLVRQDLPAGTTTISSAYLQHNTQFMQFVGQPDTPDAFGNTAPIAFGPAPVVLFTADGMLTDTAGNPVNGTIFLGEPGKPMTARALTIFGATARIRTYRWNGGAWRP
jgi:prepilin-type N-terminal cleavage/methylation domain-containing protein